MNRERSRCSCCGKSKPVSQFNKAKSRKAGIDSRCKACRGAYRCSLDGRAAALLKDARLRAKAKGIKFSLTREWVKQRLDRWTCEATGWLFVIQSGRGHHPFAPSIDRINAARGYTPTNCRLVISAVNTLKGTLMVDVAAAVSPIQTFWDVERRQIEEFGLYLAMYGQDLPLPLAA